MFIFHKYLSFIIDFVLIPNCSLSSPALLFLPHPSPSLPTHSSLLSPLFSPWLCTLS